LGFPNQVITVIGKAHTAYGIRDELP